ncbi:MAG: hypothetical protein RLZ25_269 [Pseudomonadota bacterium]|jgi:conjugal transfer pilus assembly protein TraK
MKMTTFCLIAFWSLSLQASEHPGDAGPMPVALKKTARNRGQTIEVRPGETVTASIALREINRIVLPFDHPEIRTLNPATAEIQGHVLYIAPVDPARINLYVTNVDDPDAAIALHLVPQEMTPQEMTLELSADLPPHEPIFQRGKRDDRSEEEAPTDLTRHLLKTLALGQIPEGYHFRVPGPGESIRCRQKHLLVTTRQVFEGSDMQIRVGVVKNSGKAPLTLEEETCIGSTPLQAVATYPSGPLEPGHEAEIFVVVHEDRPALGRTRPALITKKS